MAVCIDNDPEEFMLTQGDIVIFSDDGWDDVLKVLVLHAQEHLGPEWTAEMVLKALQDCV